MRIVSKYDGLLASFYDADHSWRDYQKQSALIASLYPIKKQRNKIEILDLCCGSGSHALLLARQGFKVTGMDISSTLLREARKKIERANLQVSFRKENIFLLNTQSEFLSRFDCATLLGWTLNIQPIFKKFSRILQGAYEVLKPGGLFVFDASLGTRTHRVSSHPLQYELSSGWQGILQIQDRADPKKPLRHLSYHWTIFKKNGHHHLRELHLTAKESLAILKSHDLFSLLKAYSNRFEIVSALRDYKLGLSYQHKNTNLVMILQKRLN